MEMTHRKNLPQPSSFAAAPEVVKIPDLSRVPEGYYLKPMLPSTGAIRKVQATGPINWNYWTEQKFCAKKKFH